MKYTASVYGWLPRLGRTSILWGLMGVLLGTAPAIGQTTGLITRIEEDWELVVNEPDALVEAPQFHTVMSPFGHLDWYYAMTIWNYREFPDYWPGGLQLQSWRGDYRLRRRSVGDQLLSTTAETITWTQGLATDGIQLLFEITNGHSETWGDFGRDMQIYEYAFVSDLGLYQPNVSVENSWITYGSNRVDKLTITEVRWYGQNGLISVDSVPKVVYERLDPISETQDPELSMIE